MLYHLFELSHAAMSPARAAAGSCKHLLRNPFNPLAHTAIGKGTAAACELLERSTRRYRKPEFGIKATMASKVKVRVSEDVVWQRPFCRLVHFRRHFPARVRNSDAKLLIVAPMSGHFATLLRGTVEGLLPFHEVYITDWADARMVPQSEGGFSLSDYIDYVIEMLRLFQGDVHVLGVCQPSVPVLAAIAYMEAEKDAHVPRSMILMGGPIDTRINPTVVNKLAQERGADWFRDNVITAVPWPHPGQGRLVYPGFLQLTGFMTMNLDRHLTAHRELYNNLVDGDGDSAGKHKEFYDEYLAVMDLTAEFYLQTVDSAFIKHELPKGRMMHRGRRLDLGSITRVAMMTIEGEKDDITGVGQCKSAHGLCRNLRRSKKRHYLQREAGHFGIFNGSRFRKEIVPRITVFVRRHDPRTNAAKRLLARLGLQPGVRPAPRAISAGASSNATPAPLAALHKRNGTGGSKGGSAAASAELNHAVSLLAKTGAHPRAAALQLPAPRRYGC